MLSFRIQISAPFLSIDLQLPEDGITAIFGPTGAGKSTFFKVIVGLVRYEKILITVNDRIWQDTHHFMSISDRQVALVKQRPYLFPHMTVLKNLLYPLKRRQSRISMDMLISAFELSGLLEKAPNRLSGGELQRVAIVQALLSNPKVLLLDEAFSAMDEKQKGRVIRALQTHLSDHPCTVLMITHHIKELAILAERVLLLSSGKIEKVLDKSDFLALYQETLALEA